MNTFKSGIAPGTSRQATPSTSTQTPPPSAPLLPASTALIFAALLAAQAFQGQGLAAGNTVTSPDHHLQLHHGKQPVRQTGTLRLLLAPGGGCAIRFVPVG